MKRVIHTIGHSTRTIEDFVALLQAHGIEKVIDIRTIAQSKHNPQFNRDELQKSLRRKKIGYRHLKKLGGLRHPKKDSLNTGWESPSFRGYADYMQTEEFKEGLNTLMELAGKNRLVLMCAEAVPWRCHRSLVADALTLKKWKVLHIQSKKTAKQHALTSFLQPKRGKLLYPKPS